MGLEENSVNGSGAMDEEVRRQLEQDLLKHIPDLSKNPALLKMMVQAVGKVGGGSGMRPSEALDSQGRVNGSDLGQDEGFWRDMEGYRRENMGNWPPEAEKQGKTVARIMATENADPNDEHELSRNPRYFGRAGDGSTPGQRFVQKALADTNQMPMGNGKFLGNTDPNDRGEGGGKSVFDDRVTPGNPNPNPGKGQPIRNIPAAGRFGIRRAR